MKRGDLYWVRRVNPLDPRDSRVFVVVSRQTLIDSAFSTVCCVPVYSRWDELSTQVPLGVESGLKHDSSIHCDEVLSLPKTMLTDYIGALDPAHMTEVDHALKIALSLED